MPEKSQNKGQRQDEPQSDDREGKPGKSTRGFAAMDPQRQRDIASEGGRAAHEQGKAHKFTPEEAREAGRKGGMASGAARASRSKARATQASQNPGGPGGTGAGQSPTAAPGSVADEEAGGPDDEDRRDHNDNGRR